MSKTFIFYTTEGKTYAPHPDKEVENCQVLGVESGKNKKDALKNLLVNNPWIVEAGFNTVNIIGVQLLTNECKADIMAIVDYLWEDEHTHFQECNYPKNHIFRNLKSLKKVVK